MADKYDNGGYSSSDFKRNASQNSGGANGPGEHQDGEDGAKLNEKAGEYMRDLLSEKIKLNNAKFPISLKLIDEGTVIPLQIFHKLWSMIHSANSVSDCLFIDRNAKLKECFIILLNT